MYQGIAPTWDDGDTAQAGGQSKVCANLERVLLRCAPPFRMDSVRGTMRISIYSMTLNRCISLLKGYRDVNLFLVLTEDPSPHHAHPSFQRLRIGTEKFAA